LSLSAVPSTLPRSGNSIRSWLLAFCQQQKVSLQQNLTSAGSSIHTSFDLWTSGNVAAYLGLVGYWISSTGDKLCTLLGLQRLIGPHTGGNQAALVWNVMQEYGIEKR
jgi:hypothetical protein